MSLDWLSRVRSWWAGRLRSRSRARTSRLQRRTDLRRHSRFAQGDKAGCATRKRSERKSSRHTRGSRTARERVRGIDHAWLRLSAGVCSKSEKALRKGAPGCGAGRVAGRGPVHRRPRDQRLPLHRNHQGRDALRMRPDIHGVTQPPRPFAPAARERNEQSPLAHDDSGARPSHVGVIPLSATR